MDDRPPPSLPPPVGITISLFAALLLVSTFPACVRPWLVTAWQDGEADNHAWMHWQQLHPGRVWSNWPEGTGLVVLDPVNTCWYAAGGVTGDWAVAWNAMWIANVVLALLGGLLLGHVTTRRFEGAWIGMTALGCAPVLHASGAFGLTEVWPLGFLAMALVASIWIARSTDAAADALGRVFLAMQLFSSTGLYVAWFWSGPYGALFGLVAIVAVVAGTRPIAAAPALAGAVLAAPHTWRVWSAAAAFRTAAVPPPEVDPGWLDRPAGGVDLLSLFLPHVAAIPAGRPAYLGVVLLLCVLGTALGTRDRLLRACGIGAAVLVFLALGTHLRVAGFRLVPLPMELLSGTGLHHWWRALGPAVVLLVPLAATTAVRLADAGGGTRRALALCALLAADALAASGNPWPKEQVDPRPPQAWRAVPGGDALIVIPFDTRSEFGTGTPRPLDRWGPWMRRPLAENYDGEDFLLRTNRLIATIDRACGGEGHPGPGSEFDDATALQGTIVAGAKAAIAEAGGATIVVDRGRVADRQRCEAVVTAALGSPIHDRDGLVAWSIARSP